VTPVRARLWHMPQLLGVLWAFTRHTAWLPCRRPRRVDVALMARIIRRGWVRQVAGAAFIARDGSCIHALYVHPAWHRQGLGRALLDEAKRGCARLELWVLAQNTAARQFYASQGFKEVLGGRGMGNDEGLPDILMVWEAK